MLLRAIKKLHSILLLNLQKTSLCESGLRKINSRGIKTLTIRWCFFLLLCFSCHACYTVTFTSLAYEKPLSHTPSSELKNSFLFWGIKGQYDIYPRNYCAGELPIQYATHFTWQDSLISIATLGLYTTRTVTFWCTYEENTSIKTNAEAASENTNTAKHGKTSP